MLNEYLQYIYEILPPQEVSKFKPEPLYLELVRYQDEPKVKHEIGKKKVIILEL